MVKVSTKKMLSADFAQIDQQQDAKDYECPLC